MAQQDLYAILRALAAVFTVLALAGLFMKLMDDNEDP